MEHWVYTASIFGHGVSFNMDTILTMWFTMLLLIVLALLTTRNLNMVPGKLQLVGEGIIKYFNDISKASMGNENAQKHIAIILTLFMFILTANLVGQLPLKLIHLANGELASPNNDINMTAAMAIVVSIYYIFYGVKKNGFRFFFKGFSIDGIIITLVDTLELFEHEFKSFCAVNAQSKTSVRTIYACTVTKEADIITIRVTGNGFLYNMVRIIAGTLIKVGAGEFAPQEMQTILDACDRSVAGPTAPAHGLTMIGLEYE